MILFTFNVKTIISVGFSHHYAYLVKNLWLFHKSISHYIDVKIKKLCIWSCFYNIFIGSPNYLCSIFYVVTFYREPLLDIFAIVNEKEFYNFKNVFRKLLYWQNIKKMVNSFCFVLRTGRYGVSPLEWGVAKTWLWKRQDWAQGRGFAPPDE